MLFKYKIEWVDNEEDYEIKPFNGVTWAENFSSAMKNLEHYYGEEEIEKVLLLEPLIDTDVVEME